MRGYLHLAILLATTQCTNRKIKAFLFPLKTPAGILIPAHAVKNKRKSDIVKSLKRKGKER